MRLPTNVAQGGGEGRSPRAGRLAAQAEFGAGTVRTEHPRAIQALASRARGSSGERLLLVETIPSPEKQKLPIWEGKGRC